MSQIACFMWEPLYKTWQKISPFLHLFLSGKKGQNIHSWDGKTWQKLSFWTFDTISYLEILENLKSISEPQDRPCQGCHFLFTFHWHTYFQRQILCAKCHPIHSNSWKCCSIKIVQFKHVTFFARNIARFNVRWQQFSKAFYLLLY